MTLRRNSFVTLLIMLVLVVTLAACGSAEPSTPTAAPATVTPIPVFQYSAPTAVPQMATVAARNATSEPEAVAINPTQVARGADRYTALECNTCHGDSGEGTEKGSPLTSFAMSEADFISFMRSGGTMGADHQYSTNRLSTSGGANLYQYLLTLSDAQ